MKKLIGLSCFLMSLNAWADNTPDAFVRNQSAVQSVSISTGDNSIGMTLYYVGSATEAVADINGTRLQLQAPYGTVDTGVGGTSGVFLFSASTTNTVGQICNSINTSTNYRCLLGGLPSDYAPKFLGDVVAAGGANNLKSNGGYQVLIDTNPAVVAASTVTYSVSLGIWPLSTNHRVRLKKCFVNVQSAAGDYFAVYGKLRAYDGVQAGGVPDALGVTSVAGRTTGGVGTKDDSMGNGLAWFEPIATSSTDQTIDFTLAQNDHGIEFAKGAHVVVMAGNGTTVQSGQSSKTRVACLWDDVSN